MPYQNIGASLTAAQRDLLMQNLIDAELMMPWVVNLAKGEKKKALQLGKKTEKFLFDIERLMDNSPVLIPGYVNTVEYDKDFQLFISLQPVELKLRMMLEAVSDTRHALAQECQKPALAIYKNVKAAALNNVPGADTALDSLTPYFKKVRKKKK